MRQDHAWRSGSAGGAYERYSRAVYSFACASLATPRWPKKSSRRFSFASGQQESRYRSARGSLITWLLTLPTICRSTKCAAGKRRPQKAESDERKRSWPRCQTRTRCRRRSLACQSFGYRSRTLQQLPAAQREAIELAYFRADHAGDRRHPRRAAGTIKTRMRLGMHKHREQLGPVVSEFTEPNEVKLS